MSDAVELPRHPGLDDPDCWVRLKGDEPSARWFIAGSAHTHRGHLYVERPSGQERTVNLNELAEASPRARVWLSGFLQGQEPGLWEFLGSDDDALDAYTEADVERWEQWNATFRSRGWPNTLHGLPPAADELNEVGAPTPWVFVGGLYREFRQGAWIALQPQPAGDAAGWWAPNGSVCQDRGHHSFEQLRSVSLCEDCHRVDR